MKLKLLSGLLLVGLTSGATALGAVQEARAPEVRVLDCGSGDVLPGTVRPRREVVLGPKFDAILASVLVEEGQVVRAGDVLAQLDDRSARATLRLAEQAAGSRAHLDRAKAVLDRSADRLERMKEAVAESAASESELTEAESEHRIAMADCKIVMEDQQRAALQLELALVRLEEHVIRAPFDAVVTRVRGEAGAMVSAGEPVVEVISQRGVRVDLYLPATVASGLRAGERYAVTVMDPTEHLTAATVRAIEPRIDPISRTMRVVFDIDASIQTIYAGALVLPADRVPEAAGFATAEESLLRTGAADGP